MLPGGVDRGGVDRVVPAFLWLIERLARRHDVHVFAMQQEKDPGDWDLVGARVHNIGTARGSTRRLMTRFSAEHAARPFDVIHAFFGWCGASAALVGRRRRVPVVFHAAGGEFVGLRDVNYGMRHTVRDSLAARLATGARRVTVATTYMQRLAAARGVSAEVVPLGVALDRWPVAAPRDRDLSAPIRLLHVGDVRPVKDQSMLMAAASALRRSGLAFELHAAGLGTDGESLRRSAEAHRLSDAFHGHGVLRRDALRALVDCADLLLLTSRHEAGPLVVLEAAVAGVPTVGTAVGHVADWADDGAAIAVPIADSAAMAREIAALATDETHRQAIAHRAQRLASTIDADHTAAAFERIYSSVCGIESEIPSGAQ